jgi:hypothetical protein
VPETLACFRRPLGCGTPGRAEPSSSCQGTTTSLGLTTTSLFADWPHLSVVSPAALASSKTGTRLPVFTTVASPPDPAAFLGTSLETRAPARAAMALYPSHGAHEKDGLRAPLTAAAWVVMAAKERDMHKNPNIKCQCDAGSGDSKRGRQVHAGHQKRETTSFGNTLAYWREPLVSLISRLSHFLYEQCHPRHPSLSSSRSLYGSSLLYSFSLFFHSIVRFLHCHSFHIIVRLCMTI